MGNISSTTLCRICDSIVFRSVSVPRYIHRTLTCTVQTAESWQLHGLVREWVIVIGGMDGLPVRDVSICKGINLELQKDEELKISARGMRLRYKEWGFVCRLDDPSVRVLDGSWHMPNAGEAAKHHSPMSHSHVTYYIPLKLELASLSDSCSGSQQQVEDFRGKLGCLIREGKGLCECTPVLTCPTQHFKGMRHLTLTLNLKPP